MTPLGHQRCHTDALQVDPDRDERIRRMVIQGGRQTLRQLLGMRQLGLLLGWLEMLLMLLLMMLLLRGCRGLMLRGVMLLVMVMVLVVVLLLMVLLVRL